MGFFQEIDEQYFVEEISYDDMMSILEHQKHQHDADTLQTQSLNKPSGGDTKESSEQESSVQHITKADEIARRIAENANKKLPNWLLNHH